VEFDLYADGMRIRDQRVIYHFESNRSLRKQPSFLEKMGIIQCLVWKRYCKKCK